MASVSDYFGRLISRIQPSQTELDTLDRHLSTVTKTLKNSVELRKPFTAGSFNRSTNVSGHSDADMFAVISLDELKWGSGRKSSHAVLETCRLELAARLPSTPIRRDVHAIVLEFRTATVDLVPAAWSRFLKQHKRPLYLIPDGEGDWMESSPELHNDFLKQKNKEAGGKLRTVAQLMKFWRECRSPRIPLSSFYIEMLLATEGICVGVKSYSRIMTELLQLLAARDCSAIEDPFGVCSRIRATKTSTQRTRAIASIRNSRDHAKDALAAELDGNKPEAIRQWDLVFNDSFR